MVVFRTAIRIPKQKVNNVPNLLRNNISILNITGLGINLATAIGTEEDIILNLTVAQTSIIPCLCAPTSANFHRSTYPMIPSAVYLGLLPLKTRSLVPGALARPHPTCRKYSVQNSDWLQRRMYVWRIPEYANRG